MPTPTQDLNHVTEGQKLLTSHYASAPVISGMVKALMLRFQEIEGALFSLLNGIILNNHPMPGGPWNILDQLGAIVGEPRNGRDDATYVQAIRLRIRVNRSRGLAEDIIQIGQLATGVIPYYLDMPPASFILETLDVIAPATVAALITQARSAGTYGSYVYTTWSTGNDFKFTSRYGGAPDEGLWSSRYSPSTGGLLVACFGV